MEEMAYTEEAAITEEDEYCLRELKFSSLHHVEKVRENNDRGGEGKRGRSRGRGYQQEEYWGRMRRSRRANTMIRLTTMVVPTPPLPSLPELDWARSPPPRDGSALLFKRSLMSSLSATAVGRTAKADNLFASFVDAAAADVIVDEYSSLAAAEKSTELSSLAAATAMETIAIDANTVDDKEAVILRRHFVNTGGGRILGKETMKTTTTKVTGKENDIDETKEDDSSSSYVSTDVDGNGIDDVDENDDEGTNDLYSTNKEKKVKKKIKRGGGGGRKKRCNE